jgi:membrane protease YdiL (CAAX protease family)
MSLANRACLSPLLPAAIALGCIALAIRPAALVGAMTVTVVVGVIGLAGPLPQGEPRRSSAARWAAAVVLGVGAFAATRALSPHVPASPVTVTLLAAVVLASAAEEVFFRRLVYGWFAASGVGPAIAAAAVMFAAVHIPAHGARVLPLDLAAGILLGWQRWATGGWSAPVFTHIAANLLQMR